MYYSERVTLRKPLAFEIDEDGAQVVSQWREREVWADRRSPTRREFYEAGRSGIDLTDTFAVHGEDYGGEMQLCWNGQLYTVVRAYEKGDTVELSCRTKDVEHGQV